MTQILKAISNYLTEHGVKNSYHPKLPATPCVTVRHYLEHNFVVANIHYYHDNTITFTDYNRWNPVTQPHPPQTNYRPEDPELLGKILQKINSINTSTQGTPL